jgi:hypothetical protein
MIYNTATQAVMLAFIDNFKMLGVVFFAIIPVLLLMKKPRAAAGNAGALRNVPARRDSATSFQTVWGRRWQRNWQ